jgi:5-keto-L-gluconate epimerase
MKLSVAVAGREAMPDAFVVFRGLQESVKKAADLGYDGVELALKRPDEITREELRKLLKDTHMEVSAISSGQVWAARQLCFTEENAEKRKELKQTFCGFIDLAADFSRFVNIGRTRGSIDGRGCAHCEQLFLDMAGELSDYAEQRDVTLILEPVNRYEINFVNNLDEGSVLVKKVNRKNFAMMADVFHMNIEDARIGESLERNGPYVRYVHFADTNRHAPGQGHMNWDEIFTALKKNGYNGWTTVEILPWPDPETAAKQAVTFIRNRYGLYYQ